MEVTNWKQLAKLPGQLGKLRTHRGLQELHSVGKLIIILSAQLVLALLKAIWENSVLAKLVAKCLFYLQIDTFTLFLIGQKLPQKCVKPFLVFSSPFSTSNLENEHQDKVLEARRLAATACHLSPWSWRNAAGGWRVRTEGSCVRRCAPPAESTKQAGLHVKLTLRTCQYPEVTPWPLQSIPDLWALSVDLRTFTPAMMTPSAGSHISREASPTQLVNKDMQSDFYHRSFFFLYPQAINRIQGHLPSTPATGGWGGCTSTDKSPMSRQH